MEPFRVGTDRLPVYTISWNRSEQYRSFRCTHVWRVPNDSLSIHSSGTKQFLKKFFHYTLVLWSLTQNFLREQIFQLSSAFVGLISPCLVSQRTWWERFCVLTLEFCGSIPCGTYFLGGPALVPLAVLSETVPSVPVETRGLPYGTGMVPFGTVPL